MTRRTKGTGYLISNSDGTKTLRKTITNPNTGKQTRIQVTANTETACNKKMAARERALEELYSKTGVYSSMTVAELCYSYLEHKFSKGIMKRTSRDREEVTIRNQIEPSSIGHLQILTVTTRDIDKFFTKLLAEKKLSASSIDKVRHALDPAFRWAVDNKQIPENPINPIRKEIVDSIETLKKKGADDADVIILSDTEKTKAWEIASEKWSNGNYKYPGGLHFKFLVETGLRVGEWIALRWEDYDFKNNILKIEKNRHLVKANEDETSEEVSYIAHEGDTKNSKARNLQLSEKAAEILMEIYDLTPWKDPKDYICLTRYKGNYTATSMEKIVNTVYRNAGLGEHASGLHILRRTFATSLYDQGYTIKDIAAYLGDLESTVSKYYIASRKKKEVNGKMVAVVELKKK